MSSSLRPTLSTSSATFSQSIRSLTRSPAASRRAHAAGAIGFCKVRLNSQPSAFAIVETQPMIQFEIASGSGLFAFICGPLRSFALNLPFHHHAIAMVQVKKDVTQMNANTHG